MTRHTRRPLPHPPSRRPHPLARRAGAMVDRIRADLPGMSMPRGGR